MGRRINIIGSTSNNLLRDLLYWWDLDAGGATITDQHSGLVLTRAGAGGVTEVGTAPDGGNCIRFGNADGSQVTRFRVASLPKPSAYDTGFTVNIWARKTGSSTSGNIFIEHREGSSPLYFEMRAITLGSTKRAIIWHDLGSNQVNGGSMPLDVWQMCTAVRRGSNLEFWKNGIIVASTIITGTIDTGNADYAIGANSWAPSIGSLSPHLGQLWCAGQWNRALSAAEIQALYNGGTGRKYAAL